MLHYVHIQNNDSNYGCLKNEQVAKYKLWHIVASTSYIILRQNNQSLYCNAICTRYIRLNSAYARRMQSCCNSILYRVRQLQFFFFGFFKTAMSFPRKQSVIQLYSNTGSISDSEEHRCEEEYVLYIRFTCALYSSRIKLYRRHSQW